MTTQTQKTQFPETGPKTPVEGHQHNVGEHPLLALRQDVDRLFDNFFSGFTLGPFGRRTFDVAPARWAESLVPRFADTWPKMDVVENDHHFRATVELPGMDEKDVDITVDGNMLTIRGEKTEEKKDTKEEYRLTECHHGVVERSFRLPDTVDPHGIEAEFQKGVLTVTLPKVKEEKKAPRKIDVKGR